MYEPQHSSHSVALAKRSLIARTAHCSLGPCAPAPSVMHMPSALMWQCACPEIMCHVSLPRAGGAGESSGGGGDGLGGGGGGEGGHMGGDGDAIPLHRQRSEAEHRPSLVPSLNFKLPDSK